MCCLTLSLLKCFGDFWSGFKGDFQFHVPHDSKKSSYNSWNQQQTRENRPSDIPKANYVFQCIPTIHFTGSENVSFRVPGISLRKASPQGLGFWALLAPRSWAIFRFSWRWGDDVRMGCFDPTKMLNFNFWTQKDDPVSFWGGRCVFFCITYCRVRDFFRKKKNFGSFDPIEICYQLIRDPNIPWPVSIFQGTWHGWHPEFSRWKLMELFDYGTFQTDVFA